MFLGEYCRQSYPAALTHLQIIHHLSAFLHPKSNALDAYVLDLVHHHDVYLSLEIGTRPIFPLTWEPPDPAPARQSSIRRELDRLIYRPRKRALWTLATAMTSEDHLLGTQTGPLSFLSRRPSASESHYLGVDLAGAEQLPGCGFTEALRLSIFTPAMTRTILKFLPRIEVATFHHLSACSKPSIDPPPIPMDRLVKWMNKKAIATLHRLVSAQPATATGRP